MPMLAIPGERLLGEQFYRSLHPRARPAAADHGQRRGPRFVDEAQPYNEIGKALHAPGRAAFT